MLILARIQGIAGGCGVAGDVGHGNHGGGRSSARCGRGAAARFQANGEHKQKLRGPRSSTRCSDASLALRNDDGDKRGGGELRPRWPGG